MKREKARAEQAFELAEQGKTVCVISSGDAGIYGMAPLVLRNETRAWQPGGNRSIAGYQCFSESGFPVGSTHRSRFLCDFSLRPHDAMDRIEKRIHAAATADFVTAVYNPKSEGRYWQLYRLKEIFLKEREAETPVGLCVRPDVRKKL